MTRFVTVAGLALAASAAHAQQLYFAEIFYPTLAEGTIQRIDVTGANQQPVATIGGGLRSIDVDATNLKVYWSDVDAFAIRRANLDGTNQEDVLAAGLEFVTAIRLEPAEDRLWFGDASAETISYLTVSSGAGPFLWGGFAFFRGLALDSGEIFFTTSISPTSGRLYRSTTPGPPLPPIVTTGKPAAVAVDRAGGKVYFTDTASRSVKRADLDGNNLQTLYTDPGGFQVRGIAVDPLAGKVYWGQDMSEEENLGAIYSMDLDGSNIVPVLLGVGFVNDLVLVRLGDPPTCYANCDGSTQEPTLNVADFTCFLQRFAAGESYANCDNSTQQPVLNVADFTCFLQRFAQGCP
jgi:DNA-binding beta-propeller fold protein YncE